MPGVCGSNDRKKRGGAEKVGRNFSKPALSLGLFAAVFLALAGRVAADLVETTAGRCRIRLIVSVRRGSRMKTRLVSLLQLSRTGGDKWRATWLPERRHP